MICVEDAPKSRKSNDVALIWSREWRWQKKALEKEKVLENAENELIENLVYHKTGHLGAYWATVGEVTTELRRIKPKE